MAIIYFMIFGIVVLTSACVCKLLICALTVLYNRICSRQHQLNKILKNENYMYYESI